MTQTVTHTHDGGLDVYHDPLGAGGTVAAVWRHLRTGHGDYVATGIEGHAALVQRHRQWHGDRLCEGPGCDAAGTVQAASGEWYCAGCDAIARGAELGRAFAGAGRQTSERAQAAVPRAAVAAPSGDRSIYLSDGNGGMYLAEPMTNGVPPLYRLTVEPTKASEGGDRQDPSGPRPGDPLGPPSGQPDPAVLIAAAIMSAARWVVAGDRRPTGTPPWVESKLAVDIRKALESYR